jgi:hypothetical protein
MLAHGSNTKGRKASRWEVFHNKGFSCVSCGIEGTHVAIWAQPSHTGRAFHVDLLGVDDDGEEVLLTKDHVYPKALGGSDLVGNTQPMCERCNHRKSSSLTDSINTIVVSTNLDISDHMLDIHGPNGFIYFNDRQNAIAMLTTYWTKYYFDCQGGELSDIPRLILDANMNGTMQIVEFLRAIGMSSRINVESLKFPVGTIDVVGTKRTRARAGLICHTLEGYYTARHINMDGQEYI